MTSLMSPEADAPLQYSSLVVEQLTEERARKASLEQRGAFVITSAGALVTLLFGLAALVTDAEGFLIKDASRNALIAALAAFFVTGLLGLATNAPLFLYEEPNEDELKQIITDPSIVETTAANAARELALVRLKTVKSYRTNNARKTWILAGGLLAEAVGTGFVAYSIYLILRDGGSVP